MTSHTYTIMREQLQAHLNHHHNLLQIVQIIADSYQPFSSLVNLPIIPQLGISVSSRLLFFNLRAQQKNRISQATFINHLHFCPKLILKRPMTPVLVTFCLLPQSHTITNQSTYCLEVRFCGAGLVSIRDGDHSFNGLHSVEEFTPTKGLSPSMVAHSPGKRQYIFDSIRHLNVVFIIVSYVFSQDPITCSLVLPMQYHYKVHHYRDYHHGPAKIPTIGNKHEVNCPADVLQTKQKHEKWYLSPICNEYEYIYYNNCLLREIIANARLLPNRSWAGAYKTQFTVEALDTICVRIQVERFPDPNYRHLGLYQYVVIYSDLLHQEHSNKYNSASQKLRKERGQNLEALIRTFMQSMNVFGNLFDLKSPSRHLNQLAFAEQQSWTRRPSSQCLIYVLVNIVDSSRIIVRVLLCMIAISQKLVDALVCKGIDKLLRIALYKTRRRTIIRQ